MKSVIAIAATLVLSLAFAPAFADDFATLEGRDLGIELYESSLAVREAPPTMITKVPVTEEYRDRFFSMDRDVGIKLYETHLAFEAERIERGIEAGGVSAKEVEKSWDYLGPGGSDLP